MLRFFRSAPVVLAACFVLLAGFSSRCARAQTSLFADEFNGTSLSSTAWSVYDASGFLQRTQFGNTPVFGTEGTTKFTRLRLDSYNPDSRYSGTYLRGTEMLTKQKFTVGSGIEFEARLRGANLPAGIVFAFFTLGEKGIWPTTYARDEIDFEHLTNQGNNKLWLNAWNDWNPGGTGQNVESNGIVAGLNWNNWTTYKIRWLPNRVEWYVNVNGADFLIRTETVVVPNDPQTLRFNIWAPSTDWARPYDATLPVTKTASQNQTFYFDVDYVRVRSISGTTPTPTPTPTPAVVGTGDGLRGDYYDNSDFTGTLKTRVDPTVDFDWGTAAPIAGMGADTFSTRWTGQVQAQYSQTYTFTTKTDDGVRLWVNGVQLINQWKAQAATEYSGTIALTAGQKYSIKMEYYDDASSASSQLYWSSASTPKTIVPKSQLYSLSTAPSSDATAPVASIATPVSTWSYKTLATVSGTASDTGGSNLANVRLRILRRSNNTYWNGTAWTTTEAEVAATGTANWTFTLPALADGQYSLRAAARDGAGNVGYSALTEFYIDSIVPIATISSPVHTWSYATLSQVTGTASDAVGVSDVRVRLFRFSDSNYWNGSTWITTVTDALASGTTSWTYTLPTLTDGKYSVVAIARDYVGNAFISAASEFVSDRTAPLISVLEPKSGAAYPSLPSANGTASDANGLSEVRGIVQRASDGKYWNGTAWVAAWTEVLANGTTSWAFTMPALTKGQYTFWAVARDWPGNQTYANSVVFNVP